MRRVLKQAADRLRAHAEAHRALLPPVEGQVNLAEYLGRVCITFTRATLADCGVHLSVDSDDIWLSADRAWRIGLTVAELIRNAARHGLRGRAGSIAVRVAQAGDDVICAVGDDGRCDEDVAPGRGVSVARALANDLGGSIEWRFTERGCLARLRAPAKRERRARPSPPPRPCVADHPSPMAGTSTPRLAAGVTNSGGLGSTAIGAVNAALARRMITGTRDAIAGPLNVMSSATARPEPSRLTMPPGCRPWRPNSRATGPVPLPASRDLHQLRCRLR